MFPLSSKHFNLEPIQNWSLNIIDLLIEKTLEDRQNETKAPRVLIVFLLTIVTKNLISKLPKGPGKELFFYLTVVLKKTGKEKLRDVQQTGFSIEI